MAKNNKTNWPINKLFLVLLIGIIFSFFFSIKLLKVPMGLTVDEAAFGYNASLLAQTYHDENGRFMPVFVLSIQGKDWRQPITQYYLTFLFKIFGSSIFLLRFSSIIVFFISFLLLIYIAQIILNNFKLALFSGIIFATTPLVLIQSHLGLDNIMPIPFTILWLIFTYYYCSTKKLKYILFSAISLGINFYSYKGMRAIAPIWSILTFILIFLENNKNIKKSLKPLFIFGLGLLPFFGTSFYWDKKYPGSIFNGQSTKFDSIYNFIYPYLSSFDLTFLFIKGDNTPFHSTGIHGMMLLATLPLFITGILESVKKDSRYKFILISFFTAPLLYGFVNSVHRASRLMCLIPLYSIICAVGFNKLTQKLKFLKYIFYILIFINFIDFSKYYFNDYGKRTGDIFGNLTTYQDIKIMGQYVKENNLTPYLDPDLAPRCGESEKFFAIAYMKQPLILILNDNDLPFSGILLSHRENIDGLKRLDIKLPNYFLHTR